MKIFINMKRTKYFTIEPITNLIFVIQLIQQLFGEEKSLYYQGIAFFRKQNSEISMLNLQIFSGAEFKVPQSDGGNILFSVFQQNACSERHFSYQLTL